MTMHFFRLSLLGVAFVVNTAQADDSSVALGQYERVQEQSTNESVILNHQDDDAHTGSALSQLAALQVQQNQPQKGLSVQLLKSYDCADLSVHARNTKREMQNLLDQSQQLQTQPVSVPEVVKKSSFLGTALNLASLAGKAVALASGEPELVNLSSALSQAGNVMSQINNTRHQLAAQNFAATAAVNTEAQAADILKQYRAYEVDLENIQTYQKHKACQAI